MSSNSLLFAFRKAFSTELQHQFVPKHNPVLENDLAQLKKFIINSEKLLILTGAGISTESGIPDYRSAEVGLYARTNHKPVQYQEFLKSPKVRKRYWARNFIGWTKFSAVSPNVVHHSITNIKNCFQIVTQNVDNLHQKAGSTNVIELHGTAFRVICLNCDASYSRFYIQEKLLACNPSMERKSGEMLRPDGDVQISSEDEENFNVVACESCGGVLKPDIIFFGDNVPKGRVDGIRKAVSKSDSVLVLGSSLSVFSGYRVVLQAVEEGKNLAMVNIGPTRADGLIGLKVAAKCGDVLPQII